MYACSTLLPPSSSLACHTPGGNGSCFVFTASTRGALCIRTSLNYGVLRHTSNQPMPGVFRSLVQYADARNVVVHREHFWHSSGVSCRYPMAQAVHGHGPMTMPLSSPSARACGMDRHPINCDSLCGREGILCIQLSTAINRSCHGLWIHQPFAVHIIAALI